MQGRIIGIMEKMEWDEAKVRDLLPQVRVRIGSKEFLGQVLGRKLEVGEVCLRVPVEGTEEILQVSYAWSWGAIARALNKDEALQI